MKDREGNVRLLIQGHYNPEDSTKDSGWLYIKGRHIYGNELEEKDSTGFFPVKGVEQEIKGRDLPDAIEEEDIKKMVYEAVKSSKTNSEGAISSYELSSKLASETGVTEVTVVMRKGRIRTIWPEEGSNVHTWIEEADAWRDELV